MPGAMTLALFREHGWDEMDSGCWEWRGPRYPTGYGRCGRQYAHRVAHEEWIGPIPEGLFVLHSCDNPPCVNPAHLRAGTAAENVADRDSRGRGRTPNATLTHCKHQHEYTQENTRIDRNGHRECRTCARAAMSRRRDKETTP